MKHSYPTSEPLKFLLQMIHNREMALPDFQRDFVWDPYATDELIESIISNFPAGSLLRIKNGFQLLFQPRQIEGAPELGNAAKPSYLILDGQQRLTSLYQAFYGVGDHRYFIDLTGLEKNKDLEDCVFYLRREEGQARYGTTAQQASSLVFPLGKVFGDGGYNGWVPEVLKLRCTNIEEILDLQSRLTKLHEQWIRPIEEYEFPMVTLNEDTSAPAVCTIFETLNRTGIKLSVFELLTARFWAQELNLRKHWDDVKREFPILEDYEIDPYYLLQTIALLEPGLDRDGNARAPSIKRSAILDMKVEEVRKGWESAVAGMVDTLIILRDEGSVLIPALIPYNTMLIPMAAVWASKKDTKGADAGANRIKLLQWFWCSVFGQQYENAPNSQAEKDFTELTRWMENGNPPASVSQFTIDVLKLRNVRPRQRAIYRGTMALIMNNEAMDFHNRGRITPQLIADKRNPLDDHHIFPQAFLNDNNIPPSLRDCILNRTYIDRITNRRLSRRAPSDYFGEIRRKHGTAATDELWRSHLLPTGDDSPLLADNFEEYLTLRESAILNLIARRTGCQYLGAGAVTIESDKLSIETHANSETGIKPLINRSTPRPQWDEETFMAELERRSGSDALRIGNELHAWAKDFAAISWGKKLAMFTATYKTNDDAKYRLFSLRPRGRVVVRLGRLCKIAPFNGRNVQLELLSKFNEIPGVNFEHESLLGKPRFRMSLLADSTDLQKFKTAIEWVVKQLDS